jgi:glycosyltransferase involved in cell wall biosynthesis
MTVLFCLSHITKSLQWQWYSEELQKRGVKQVYVIIDTNNGKGNYLFEDLKNAGFDVYLLPHKNKFSHAANIFKTVSIIRRHKPDIIHTSLPFGNLVGQMAAKLAGIKNKITTCENASWAHDFKSKTQEWIDNMTFKASKKIVANSEVSADYLRKNWDFDKSKLEVIYHGWKTTEYEVSPERIEKIRKELGMDKKNEFVVGVLARFEFWKGYEYIIEAANILKDHPGIKFYVFGNKADYYDEAMRKISVYKLEDKVKHTPFVVDSPALYQLFDVHLHIPIDQFVETGGLTIVDGMFAARPQVLTLSGYANQVTKHMQNAFVVPYKNAQATADAILWMKNNPVKAAEMATQAKNDAIEMFGIEKKTEKYMSLYKKLLL